MSAPARHAAERAAQLAASIGARLTLVHAVSASAVDELRQWLGGSDPAAAHLIDDARARLQSLAQQLEQRHGIPVAELVATGPVIPEVTRIAQEVDADLIVTGTRGAGFMHALVTGTTAERIAKRSSRPVLLVRQLARAAYRRVLVPVDFSSWSAGALDLALRVAPGATLVLMHAVEVPFEGRLLFAGVEPRMVDHYRANAQREAQRKLHDLATAAGLPSGRYQVLTPAGAPWVQVAQQEQEHDCDLVVIGKHGRHALDDLLLGSTTRMVMTECGSDVLVSTSSGG
jgi:nucleotide-binding universal stress UspA family protein